jgi:hypothetical protein
LGSRFKTEAASAPPGKLASGPQESADRRVLKGLKTLVNLGKVSDWRTASKRRPKEKFTGAHPKIPPSHASRLARTGLDCHGCVVDAGKPEPKGKLQRWAKGHHGPGQPKHALLSFLFPSPRLRPEVPILHLGCVSSEPVGPNGCRSPNLLKPCDYWLFPGRRPKDEKPQSQRRFVAREPQGNGRLMGSVAPNHVD